MWTILVSTPWVVDETKNRSRHPDTPGPAHVRSIQSTPGLLAPPTPPWVVHDRIEGLLLTVFVPHLMHGRTDHVASSSSLLVYLPLPGAGALRKTLGCRSLLPPRRSLLSYCLDMGAFVLSGTKRDWEMTVVPRLTPRRRGRFHRRLSRILLTVG